MTEHRIFSTAFADVHPLYLAKVERKGRTRAELDEIIGWLTGYDEQALAAVIENGSDFRTFFERAPRIAEAVEQVTGTICGVRITEITDPLMKRIRQLDKMVDELARGRSLDKIKRTSPSTPTN